MTRVTITNYSGNIAGGGITHKDIEDLKIVSDTSKGKKEVVVYINGEAIFRRDFSRTAKMIYNQVAVYEDDEDKWNQIADKINSK